MVKNIEDRHLIDRYLQGDLSGIELENFLRKIDSDQLFKRKVELQKLIYSGIQIANQNKLKKIILSSVDYRKPTIPFALKMIVTFLVVTGLGITLWFYAGNDATNKQQSNSWFAFLKSRKNAEDTKPETPKQKPETRIKASPEVNSIIAGDQTSKTESDSSTSKISEAENAADSSMKQIPEEDIVVKQDQLMISTMLNIENRNDETVSENDDQHTSGAVALLNPAADLPEGEKVPASYIVEFWVSPINYKGYKMSKNKLILFGIDEPEDVKLYRVNEAIYMSYLRDYFLLNNSLDFVSFQKLKETEIPLAVK